MSKSLMNCVLLKDGKLEYATRKIPMVKRGWDLFQVKYVGICKTDNMLFQSSQHNDVILGHEVVLEGRNGELFALNNEIYCGACYACKNGAKNHCTNMEELGVNKDGGYAQYLLAPLDSIFKLPADIGLVGVLVEPLACVLHALERIEHIFNKSPACEVTMLGAGVASKLLTIALKHYYSDSRVSFLDEKDEALAWCSEYGTVIQDKDQMPDADIVCELVGMPSVTLYNVANYLRPTGTILIYGVPHEEGKLPQQVNARSIFDNEWTVTASKAGCSSSTMSRAIALIQENPQEFSSLIGKQVSLIESPEEIINFNPLPSTRTVVIV